MFPDVDKITKQVTQALAAGQVEMAKQLKDLLAVLTRIAVSLEKIAEK